MKKFPRILLCRNGWSDYEVISPIPEEKIFKHFFSKIPFARVFNGIKFCKHFLNKEVLPRNVSAKFGQNWPDCLEGADL